MEEIVRNRSSDDPLLAVHDARRRLLAARTARLSLTREPSAAPPEPRGLLRRLARTLIGPGQTIEAQGILDLGRPGSAYDHGQFAVTELGDGIWGGPSGRSLEGMPVDPDCRPGPLWFLGAIEFLNAASEDGSDEVDGTPCRRFRVRADLGVDVDVRAAETAGAMAWLPDVPDLAAVPLTVWIDEQFVRRVSMSAGGQVRTLELWDIGADVRGFDWSRLSTFRTRVEEDLRARPNLV